MHSEFFPQGQTVNSKYYCNIFRGFVKKFVEKYQNFFGMCLYIALTLRKRFWAEIQ